MRGLLTLWGEFAASLDQVPIIDKLNRGKFRLERLPGSPAQPSPAGGRGRALDRARVIQDRRALVRAALRFMQHAITEHRDFKMIEQDYVSVGGKLEDIVPRRRTSAPRRCTPSSSTAPASRTRSTCSAPCSSSRGSARRRPPNGADAIREPARPQEGAGELPALSRRERRGAYAGVRGHADVGHPGDPRHGQGDPKTAKVVARLYRLQLEEMGNT